MSGFIEACIWVTEFMFTSVGGWLFPALKDERFSVCRIQRAKGLIFMGSKVYGVWGQGSQEVMVHDSNFAGVGFKE